MAHLSKLVPRNTKLAYLVVLANAVVNPTTMGYDSMMMGSLNALPQYMDYFGIRGNNALIGWMSAAMWVGQILSCLFMQYFSDKFGRKNTILIACFVCMVGVILQSSAHNIAQFSIARVIIGIGQTFASTSAPNLVGELSPPNRRGFILGICFTCFQVGALIASGVTYGSVNLTTTWAWRVPSIIQAVPSLLSAFMLLFTPESPRWLISRGEYEKAGEIIEIFEHLSPEDAELKTEEIRMVIVDEKKRMSMHPWKEIFIGKLNWRRIFICIALALVIEMGGSSVGSYYLSLLLTQAGIKEATQQLQVNIVSSAWCLCVAVFGCTMFDKIGRIYHCMIATIGMIVMFFILGGLISVYGEGTHGSAGQYGSVACMFLFSGFYSFSWTPMSSLYAAEIYPFRTRAAGVTFYQFFNSGFGLLSTFILPIAMSNCGWKFYMINAGYDIIFLPIIWWVFVETKGVALEDIDKVFGIDILESQPVEFSESSSSLDPEDPEDLKRSEDVKEIEL